MQEKQLNIKLEVQQTEQKKLNFTLSPSQAASIQTLSDWWESKDRYIVLSGKPGTGKTFLAKYFVQKLNQAVPLFTAPTNEAVRQLELSVGDATCKTTFSALGLTMNTYKSKPVIMQRQLPKDFSDYNLLIVDEASMVGKQDLQEKGSIRLLLDYIEASGMRVIFLGDWAQLPPIESKTGTSPVFDQGYQTLELTEVQRHQGAILEWASLLREEILKPVRNMPAVNDGIRTWRNFKIENLSDTEFQELLHDEARIITWTNQTSRYNNCAGVNERNLAIRSKLFGGTLAQEHFVLPQDRVLFASPVFLAKDHEALTLEDLADLKKSKVTFEMKASINTKAEVIKTEVTNLMTVECYRTEVEIEGGVNETVYIPTREGEKRKAHILTELRKVALEAGDPQKAGEAWNFLHTFNQCYADVKHTYCITGHRSQGSTINKVYVDVSNILQNRERIVAFKNLYVAATRAKNELHLLRG